MSRPATWDLVEAYSNPVPADVAAALGELGVTILSAAESEQAVEYKVRCPLHPQRTGKPDRRPSCWVNAGTGAFICFSCAYSGPFVQLVADVLAVERVDAARWVLRRGTRRAGQAPPVASPAAPEPLSESALALFEPPPRSALEQRGLTEQACAHYGVLWQPRQRRWILPIRAYPGGQLLGWQEKGRSFFRNRPNGVKKSHTLFGAHTLTGRTAYLVESPLDAVRLHALGFPGAVASYGAMVSDAQMRIIKRRCALLIVALDNDRAGIEARDRLYARWRPRGMPMHFFNYGDAAGKDPGDMEPDQVIRAVQTAYLPSRRR